MQHAELELADGDHGYAFRQLPQWTSVLAGDED
jgi:hypothetical protein